MLKRVFFLTKRICFMIQIHEFFKSLTRTNIPFLLWKQVSPFFSDLDNFLNINLKIVICLTWGNCCQFGEWFLTAQISQICPDSWKLIFFNVSYIWYKSFRRFKMMRKMKVLRQPLDHPGGAWTIHQCWIRLLVQCLLQPLLQPWMQLNWPNKK